MSDIIPSTGRVLVKLGASWCQPCAMLTKIIQEHPPAIDVLEVDIDEHAELAQSYTVRGVPTLIIFNNGKEEKRTVGMLTKEKLDEFVK
jgi:thioredoxin 1